MRSQQSYLPCRCKVVQGGIDVEERKLSIPIYLNQRIVFDLLTIMEGGFSQFRSVKTSEKDEKNTNYDVAGEIGSKNVFALLNLGLKAGIGNKGLKTAQREICEDRVFTPASLFSKLRDSLIERKLLNSLDESFEASRLTPGSFVEFSGVLRKNPLVAYMEGITQMLEMALLFTSFSGKHKSKSEKEILDQMKQFANMLKQSGTLDLISEVLNIPGLKAVIPVQIEYFSNESPADIIDGQFIVLGKVVRYIAEKNSGSVNLLRGTPLAYLPETNLSEVISAFDEIASEMSVPDEFTTQIPSPVLLVIPIAIYA